MDGMIHLKTGTTCLYCKTELRDDIYYSAWPEIHGRSMSSSRRMVIVNHDGGSYHKVRIGRVVKDANGRHLKQRLKELYVVRSCTSRTAKDQRYNY